ncbi:MAG: uridine diphosphate-N-acetylglucosamine-binding protein YvcK [Parcubacteria group bacterium]|nr:uridine diphosphate-N-acetylglucosamine-binding protein YvcK [Parcubacteria group bacterium]
MKDSKKIVVIGGGTGTYTVLSGLKKYPPDFFDLTAIVTVADSGGSTGRLRDEFGYLPVGDFRMALVALADDSEASAILRRLFLHRFSRGNGLSGHNFGNLFLVAMTDIAGSEEEAIALTAKVLRVRGSVLPVSKEKLTLVAEYENGEIVRGESRIDEPDEKHDGTLHIRNIRIEPKVPATADACAAIREADCIVVGPGDLYTSTLAALVVPGIAEAIRKSSARLIHVVNLMTKYGQTHGFTARMHVKELARYAGRSPDAVLMNKKILPSEMRVRYEEQKEFPVLDDLDERDGYRIVRGDFLAEEEIKKTSSDALKRSLIRHDSAKIGHAIIGLL